MSPAGAVAPRARLRGATMIEVLVALVVTMLGLFALLGFNLRVYRAESESGQRTQALILADDMVQRIKANRPNVASYSLPAASAAGQGAPAVCNQAQQAARDLCEWGNLLRGTTETDAGGNRIGAMSDARGCVLALPAGAASAAVAVVVVWRGVSPTATPASAPCVPAGYNTGDGLMRYTSTVVGFGALR